MYEIAKRRRLLTEASPSGCNVSASDLIEFDPTLNLRAKSTVLEEVCLRLRRIVDFLGGVRGSGTGLTEDVNGVSSLTS